MIIAPPRRRTCGSSWRSSVAVPSPEVVGLTISEEAMKLNDREMLEDLIAAATNQALAKVRQQLAEESAKMAANVGLPPGMMGGLPGMGA